MLFLLFRPATSFKVVQPWSMLPTIPASFCDFIIGPERQPVRPGKIPS